jgi:hypothetical protein
MTRVRQSSNLAQTVADKLKTSYGGARKSTGARLKAGVVSSGNVTAKPRVAS